MPRAIVLHATDNVATLLDPGKEGQTCILQGEGSGLVTLMQDVPFGHKVCIAPTPAGANVLKYAQVIGTAHRALGVGEHTHVHNERGACGSVSGVQSVRRRVRDSSHVLSAAGDVEVVMARSWAMMGKTTLRHGELNQQQSTVLASRDHPSQAGSGAISMQSIHAADKKHCHSAGMSVCT